MISVSSGGLLQAKVRIYSLLQDGRAVIPDTKHGDPIDWSDHLIARKKYDKGRPEASS